MLSTLQQNVRDEAHVVQVLLAAYLSLIGTLHCIVLSTNCCEGVIAVNKTTGSIAQVHC